MEKQKIPALKTGAGIFLIVLVNKYYCFVNSVYQQDASLQ